MSAKAFTQICQEILDRYDSVLQTNSLSMQTKTEILAAKAAVQNLKDSVDRAYSDVSANTNYVKATKAQIDGFKSELENRASEVVRINSSVGSAKNAIEAIKNEIDLIKSNFDSSFADFNAKNSEFTQNSKSIKEYIDSKNSEIQNSIAINQELFKNLDENLAKNELIDRQVDIKMANLAIKANEAIDDINSIKLDVLNRVSNAKHSIEMSIIQANTISQALTYEANGAYDVLDALNNDDLADEIYLLKGEIIHANAKLSANRLALAIKAGATMAYRIKYELELPSLAELKDEYRSSNELAKDRLDKLDLMLNEADKMIRNSQFYNYLGVMI